jgi:hypothetical protein
MAKLRKVSFTNWIFHKKISIRFVNRGHCSYSLQVMFVMLVSVKGIVPYKE